MINNIKKFRLAQGIRQAELAEKASLSRVFLTNVENGRAEPSIKNALSISKALNKKVDEVFIQEDG